MKGLYIAAVAILVCAVVGVVFFALGSGPTIDLSGKTVLAIIPPTDFNDMEFSAVVDGLRSRGATVMVGCSRSGGAVGMYGKSVGPDVLLSDVRVSDYDCIVFIGGAGATVYFDDPLAHSIASEAAAAGKVVAAICVSPVTLARAGVLQGRRATVFPDYAAELENAGAMYTGEDVTVDGRIITANGPGAAEKFMWKIAEALV